MLILIYFSGSVPAAASSPVPAPVKAPSTPSGSTISTEAAKFLVLINNYRASKNLGALTPNYAVLSTSAFLSNDMAANNYFSHTDSLGRSPGARMQSFGLPSNNAENIYAGSLMADDAFTAWKNSPGDNANMLRPEFKYIGIGIAYNPDSQFRYYWTTDFSSYN